MCFSETVLFLYNYLFVFGAKKEPEDQKSQARGPPEFPGLACSNLAYSFRARQQSVLDVRSALSVRGSKQLRNASQRDP